MDYDRFVEGYNQGRIRLGVTRSRIRESATDQLFKTLLLRTDYPRMLDRLATVWSLLVIPCLIGAVVAAVWWTWWMAIVFLLAGLGCSRMSYRSQREAIRELAVADRDAFKLLLLHGAIVVKEVQDGG